MAIDILMPALSPTMTEGTLAKWLKKQGETVNPGDIIAEIETDKASMEIEAVDSGILAAILVPDGSEGVKVNQRIAILAQEGETVDLALAQAPIPAVASVDPAPLTPKKGGERIVASPLAKRIAQQKGVDLSALVGSGPNGRIVKADVDAALARPGLRPSLAQSPAPPTPPEPKNIVSQSQTDERAYELLPHSTMRRTIARRLSEAKQTIPHFYLTIDCCLDALLTLRGDLNARGDKAGIKLSVNDMIVRACAIALKRLPAVNATWAEDGLRLYKAVDISVAVAIPGGLITPIVRDADRKGLGQISAEIKDLAARAKIGKLNPEEYRGGTFSISNLGMYGIREFSAIINPPQSAILAIGAGEERAVVKNGAVTVQNRMTCCLSVDHRVIDGALGAEWLQIFKGLIEDPLSILL